MLMIWMLLNKDKPDFYKKLPLMVFISNILDIVIIVLIAKMAGKI